MKPARKPKLTTVINRPVVLDMDVDENPVIRRARERFGQPFSHEPGSTWKPRATPYLTDWLSRRKEKQA